MERNPIGDKIAKARKKTNMSQAQLAQRLFISPQAVGKWERGESVPDIITFSRLAEILGTDLNYFSENFTSPVTATVEVNAAVDSCESQPLSKDLKKLNWDMSHGNWVNADFSGLKGLGEKFSSSNIKNCKFIGSELKSLILKSNHVDNSEFSGSDISNSFIQGSHLVNALFTNCSLTNTEFSGSHMRGCDFSMADLTGAAFKTCGLAKSKMAKTVFKRTSFHNTSIEDIVFDTTFEDCDFENCGFSQVTFKNATLLNTFFKCRSLKKILFIDCRTDRITYEFLKNGNADLSGIHLLTS